MNTQQFVTLALALAEGKNKRTAKSAAREVIKATCSMVHMSKDQTENVLQAFDWDGVRVEMIKVSFARKILGLSESQWYRRINFPETPSSQSSRSSRRTKNSTSFPSVKSSPSPCSGSKSAG